MREFYLDAAEFELPDIEAAEERLRRALTHCDFASTMTLMGIERGDGKTILPFDFRDP